MLYTALHMLGNKEIKRIILCKTYTREAGEKLGHLPGDIAEKNRSLHKVL